jgi:RNA polymerase sigma-70 factor, ECF subfamily
VTSIPFVAVSPEVLAARMALTDGLNRLRIVMSTGIRRDHGVPRTRNRPSGTEAPAPAYVPGGNSKATDARLGKPTPAGAAAAAGTAAPVAPVAPDDPLGLGPAAVLGPAVGAPDLDTLGGTGGGGGPVTQPPPSTPPKADRPDPGDAAAGVWALVERAQAGDAEAFGQIYDRYLDTVFRFIYFRVGNRQLAEDLTADTFLRALKRIGSFTWQGRDPGAWLVTIARNLVADHFKSGRYRLEVTTGDVLDADREDRGPEGSPEAAVVDHITNVALLTAVKQLNPEQQECIVLRFLHGFSVAETAQAMGKNEGAIKALQYRAVRALARLLPEGFKS